MSLKHLFIQPTKRASAGRKAEARIALLTPGELREWIDQYMYIVGRSLSEHAKDPARREFLDEAVEAGRLLNLCLAHLAQRV